MIERVKPAGQKSSSELPKTLVAIKIKDSTHKAVAGLILIILLVLTPIVVIGAIQVSICKKANWVDCLVPSRRG